MIPRGTGNEGCGETWDLPRYPSVTEVSLTLSANKTLKIRQIPIINTPRHFPLDLVTADSALSTILETKLNPGGGSRVSAAHHELHPRTDTHVLPGATCHVLGEGTCSGLGAVVVAIYCELLALGAPEGAH